MTPALEYLIRSDIIKEWFFPPCSLFLAKWNGDRLVVTISEEFKTSNQYSVKHWNISSCTYQQALPAMFEYSVPKSEIFKHPSTVVSGWRPLGYEQESIKNHHNTSRSPMSAELYEHFYDHCLNSPRHQIKRLNWLWTRFSLIYIPNLTSHSPLTYCSENEIAEEQRLSVSRYMKKEWQYWQKWQQYMLLSPAELIFKKEYLE